ncbi:MAG: hypothetical protein HY040_07405 [Planctomycetes bacterium]|nr:hypothetical protein [Planctomycetota bacterium]
MSTNAANKSAHAHSAIVSMELHVNGRVLPIAQLGPNFLVLENPIDYPPTDAEITMSIDGHEDRWPVQLVDGIQAGQRKTSISRRS